MKKYDIQVTITVLSDNEKNAESSVENFLKNADRTLSCPELIDWEFTEFVPTDLKQSCCC